jgi:glycosyltransferase involved in cell wall biosynthesis
MPNGVDERAFHLGVDGSWLRREHGIADTTVVVGFVGWFVGWHQLDLLLESFARAAKGRDACLMLVGDGVLRDDLKAMAVRLGIEDQVVFPGPVPHARIPEAVEAMDVCVVPGANAYRSPIKLFEYMAMRKAVVAPAEPPIVSVIDDGVDALGFPSHDGTALSQKLGSLIEDAELRQRLGAAARAKILERHLWRHNATKVLELVGLCSSSASDGNGRPHGDLGAE